ncbi:hypothetical protein F5Y03DRAFT_30774 [Xylaria venustula]|nr:hypothetical protein F5Y03DRAFT_30774 [Xylaria venustula]
MPHPIFVLYGGSSMTGFNKPIPMKPLYSAIYSKTSYNLGFNLDSPRWYNHSVVPSIVKRHSPSCLMQTELLCLKQNGMPKLQLNSAGLPVRANRYVFSFSISGRCFISNELRWGHSVDPQCVEYSHVEGKCVKMGDTGELDAVSDKASSARSG